MPFINKQEETKTEESTSDDKKGRMNEEYDEQKLADEVKSETWLDGFESEFKNKRAETEEDYEKLRKEADIINERYA